MIEQYIGTPPGYLKTLNTSSIMPIDQLAAPDVSLLQPMALTLERNATLIIRVPQNAGYDLDHCESIHRAFKNAFPGHNVIIVYNDLEFMTITDKSTYVERITDDSSNYY